MKKYLFILAAAVVALASCNNGGGNKYTSIKFKEAKVTIAEGATQKLYLLWEPTTLDAPVCEWSSSNETVAKVDQNGNVTGVASGEANITAKLGELQAVCTITVQNELDLMTWAGWTIWNFDEETYLTDPFQVKLGDGNTYTCVMIPATAYAWDENITPTYDGKYMNGLSGAGWVVEIIDLPIYYIVEGEHKGSPVGSSYVDLVDPAKFNPRDTAYAYCAPAGKLGDSEKFYNYLNGDTTVAYTDCLTGAEVSYFDWDAKKTHYWFGIAGPGFFYGDEKSVYYKIYVNWFENQTGLVFAEDGETLQAPGIWGKLNEKFYENMPAASANKNLKPMKIVKHDKPLISKNKTVMDNKVFINK